MDSANKQTALIAETTVGTTPSTPAFLLTRDIRVGGSPQRNAARSPERRPDRMAANMYKGLNSYPKTIELPFVRDAASDVLWTSVFCAAWSTNQLKNASLQKTFTLEEKYEGGATDPYRRLTGAQCDSAQINFTLGQPGQLTFGLRALAESTATSAIASSTYTAPSPGYDPVTPADITVNSLFGLSTPKVVGLNMTISNSLRDRYAFGSADPNSIGLGMFSVEGQIQIYLAALADYSTFATRQTAQTMDITIGSTTNYKDQFVMNGLDVWNPDISDPGQSGDHIVTLNFMARYASGDTCAIILNRNVA